MTIYRANRNSTQALLRQSQPTAASRSSSARPTLEGDTWVVIPTYWGPAEGSPFGHPTPLDDHSTLPRLLDSLARQENPPPFNALVLAAAVAPQWLESATQRLNDLVAPFRKAFPIAIAGPGSLQVIERILRDEGLDSTGFDLGSYPGVRNLQLAIPAVLGAQFIIALDDDEVVPSSYLNRAEQTLQVLSKENDAFGVAGPYLNSEGSPFLPEESSPPHLFAAKSAVMNQMVGMLFESSERYPVTQFVLGGNMIFPRSLFTQVCFDPAISRGEDFDYMVNARLADICFFFDQYLTITHIQPLEYDTPSYARLRHDVYRFVYQREKIRLAGVPPKTFDPYPGCLLRSDLLEHARSALEADATPELTLKWGTPEEVLIGAQRYAAERAPGYFGFARRWARTLAFLARPECVEAVQKSVWTMQDLPLVSTQLMSSL